MRTFFLALLSFGIILCSPLLVFSVAIRNTPVSHETVKQELRRVKLYDVFVAEMNSQLDTAVHEASDDDPLKLIAPLIGSEITPGYIQKKTETLVDDSMSWLQGRGEPPVISFKDMKDSLLNKNSHVLTEIESALQEIESMKQNIPKSEEAAPSDVTVPEVPVDEIRKVISGDFTVPVGSYMAGLPVVLTAGRYILYISAFIISLNIVLLLLIAPGLQSKLRWLGSTFFITALWNIPGTFVSAGGAVVLGTLAAGTLHGIAESLVKPMVEAVFTPIFLTYARISGGVIIALFILGTGMGILSFFAGTTPVVAESAVRSGKRREKR